MLNLDHLPLSKKIMRILDMFYPFRHFLKVDTFVKQGWYSSTINLKCNESLTRGLPKKKQV